MRGARKPLLLTGLAVAAAAVLGGCDTKGEVQPLEEAMYQPPKPIVEPLVRLEPRPGGETLPETDVVGPGVGQPSQGAEAAGEVPGSLRERAVRVGDQLWVASATEYRLDQAMLQPVATARGLTFHAMAWDGPPYDRLFAAATAQPRGEPQSGARDGAQERVWREYLQVY